MKNHGIDGWFCEPDSPGQRGQVESINRQWRWWFPCGIDLAGFNPDRAVHFFNGQSQRSLHSNHPPPSGCRHRAKTTGTGRGR